MTWESLPLWARWDALSAAVMLAAMCWRLRGRIFEWTK